MSIASVIALFAIVNSFLSVKISCCIRISGYDDSFSIYTHKTLKQKFKNSLVRIKDKCSLF